MSFPERSNTLSRHYTGAQGGRKGRGLAIWPETGNKARAITLNVKLQSIAKNEWLQSEVEFNFVASYQSNHGNHPQADMADAEKQKEMDAKKAEVWEL